MSEELRYVVYMYQLLMLDVIIMYFKYTPMKKYTMVKMAKYYAKYLY